MYLRIFTAVCLLAGLSSASFAQGREPPPVEIPGKSAGDTVPATGITVERRLDIIEGALKNRSLLELAENVSSLRDELRLMRGQLEEQQHRMELIERRQEELYTDLDRRVQLLSKSGLVTETAIDFEPVQGAEYGIGEAPVTNTVSNTSANTTARTPVTVPIERGTGVPGSGAPGSGVPGTGAAAVDNLPGNTTTPVTVPIEPGTGVPGTGVPGSGAAANLPGNTTTPVTVPIERGSGVPGTAVPGSGAAANLPGNTTTPVTVPVDRGTAETLPEQTTISIPATDPLQIAAEYDQAFVEMRSGNYRRALSSFSSWLENYPDAPQRANALFWKAEVLYTQGNYADAVTAYKDLLQNHPASQKRAQSMLKIGFSEYAMGDVARAIDTLEGIVRSFPNSAEARLAQQKLNEIRSRTGTQ